MRRSVTLPAEMDAKVQQIAKRQKRSANRVLESLIGAGIEAREAEKRRFFELAERLQTSKDADEIARTKAELARLTFGE